MKPTLALVFRTHPMSWSSVQFIYLIAGNLWESLAGGINSAMPRHSLPQQLKECFFFWNVTWGRTRQQWAKCQFPSWVWPGWDITRGAVISESVKVAINYCCCSSLCCFKDPVPSICKSAVKTFVSCYRNQWLTAAPVVSSVVNLSSMLYCLHMTTRPCSLESQSCAAAANAYMTAVSTGSSTAGLFVSSEASTTPHPKDTNLNFSFFLMGLLLIIEQLQCRCWKGKSWHFTNKAHNSTRNNGFQLK